MKKRHLRGKSGRKWLWVLLIQIAATLVVFLLLSLSLWLGGFLHGLCLWLLTPIAGFLSACISTRLGFLNYLAWLVPPISQVAANLLLWGYSPNVGPVFLCGFVSLVGAATGEVLKNSHEKR